MKPYVRAMTRNVRGLKLFQTRQAFKTREGILNAISVLGNPQPHEIKGYLDRKSERPEHKWGQVLDYDEIHPKERKITMRTIHRWLRVLSKEGLVNHMDSRYSLSE